MLDLTDKPSIGEGSYGKVYRVSPRRVVKVFHDWWNDDEIEDFIDDEVRGGERPHNIPVLKVIDIKVGRRKTKGLLKKYIPKPVSLHELTKFVAKHNIEYWDCGTKNFRKDTLGKIFMVDTQIDPSS